LIADIFSSIFVAYPHIAQKGIDGSKTVVIAQGISNPTPNTIDLDLTAILESSSSYAPHLYSWNASLYLEGSDVPFTYLTVPESQAANGTQIHIRQTAQIANLTEFNKFSAKTFASDNFTIYLRGSGELKQGTLQKTSVQYNEPTLVSGEEDPVSWTVMVLTMLPGFQGLRSIEVSDIVIKNDLPYNANSMGKVAMNNPSSTSLHFGNVTLDLFVAGIAIGNTTLPNFVLTPGLQNYTMYTTSDTTVVAGLLAKKEYRCGVIPVDVKGNSSTFDGVEIPYFTKSLQDTTQHTVLNLTDALNAAGFGKIITGDCEP